MVAEAASWHLARAKVNLSLHLCGQREDGYHLLDSLVVFPAIGDRLWAEPAKSLSLMISGPFGHSLSTGNENLVMRAVSGLQRHCGARSAIALHLEKNLPVASGIGGGSTDAASALMLASREWNCAIPDALKLELGADVPVCCAGPKAHRMEGIGERISAVPRMPTFWMVLVNPLIGVPTGAVFSGVADKNPPPGIEMPDEGFSGFQELVGWLAAQRNDLQNAAIKVCPAISEVLASLSSAPLARMSGSGASCFALFERESEALDLANQIRSETGWWVAAAPVAPS